MNPLDIERLALAFTVHMKSHPTAPLVAGCDTSFES
jgi:hypothetical protein